MREMKDSGNEWIGEIPSKWKLTKLKFIADIFTGNSIKDEDKDLYNNPLDSIPYISTKDIDANDGKTDYNNGIYINEKDRNFRRAPMNSMLVCIEGGSAGKKMTHIDREIAFVNKLCCIDVKKGNDSYIYNYFQSPAFFNEFSSRLSGLIGGVSVGNLKSLSVTFPEVDEQNKITSFLNPKISQIDSIIEKTKSTIEDYKLLKESIITEAVTKGLDKNVEMKDSGVEWIGGMPKDWEITKFGRVISKTMNGLTRRNQTNESVGTIVLRIRDISNSKIDYSDVNRITLTENEIEKYLLQDGDILFVRVNGSKKLVGKNAIFYTESEKVAFNDHIIKIQLKDIVIPKYIAWVLNSYVGEEQISKYIKTSAGQYTISGEDLKKIIMIFPPLIEQIAISKFLSKKNLEINSLIIQKEKLIEDMESYKKSLIYDYVTGKKEVGMRR